MAMQAPEPVCVPSAVLAYAVGEERRVGMKEPLPKRARAMVRRGPLLRTAVSGRDESVEVAWRAVRLAEELRRRQSVGGGRREWLLYLRDVWLFSVDRPALAMQYSPHAPLLRSCDSNGPATPPLM